jgi:hypothetical protein
MLSPSQLSSQSATAPSPSYSVALQQLLAHMMHPEPLHRPTAAQLLAEIPSLYPGSMASSAVLFGTETVTSTTIKSEKTASVVHHRAARAQRGGGGGGSGINSNRSSSGEKRVSVTASGHEPDLGVAAAAISSASSSSDVQQQHIAQLSAEVARLKALLETAGLASLPAEVSSATAAISGGHRGTGRRSGGHHK